jgi:hypothetical protein
MSWWRGFLRERPGFSGEFPNCLVEWIGTDGQMPDSRILHLLRRTRFRNVAVVDGVDGRSNFLSVPVGELRRIAEAIALLEDSTH